jgi:Alpha/beta hydrolase
LKGLLSTGSSLVMYDPSQDHYGVLWGNIDASHVALFVPGVGNDGTVPGWVNSAHTIQQTAGPDSAVIVWKGYHDPGDHGTLDIANAGFTSRAETGATALTGFATGGLQLGSNQSLTIVAHSYGSVVAGVAMADDGLKPTNVVTAGSPGMTVDNVGQLHLNSSQFYAEQAPKDIVANNLGGLGNDPTSPSFGSTRLATNAPGLPSVSGHSQYFTPGTKAVQDIASVIDGNVAPANTQAPSAGDDTGAAARILVNPFGPEWDTAAQDYHGPGSSLVGAVAHLNNLVSNNVDAGVRDGTNGVESGAKKVWGWVS